MKTIVNEAFKSMSLTKAAFSLNNLRAAAGFSGTFVHDHIYCGWAQTISKATTEDIGKAVWLWDINPQQDTATLIHAGSSLFSSLYAMKEDLQNLSDGRVVIPGLKDEKGKVRYLAPLYDAWEQCPVQMRSHEVNPSEDGPKDIIAPFAFSVKEKVYGYQSILTLNSKKEWSVFYSQPSATSPEVNIYAKRKYLNIYQGEDVKEVVDKYRLYIPKFLEDLALEDPIFQVETEE